MPLQFNEVRSAIDKLLSEVAKAEASFPAGFTGAKPAVYKDGKLSGLMAPYVTHHGGHTSAKTISQKKEIITFLAGMGIWNGVLIQVNPAENNGIPKHIQSYGMDWWADTLNRAYEDLPLPQYYAMAKKFITEYGARGGVIDDGQNFTQKQMEEMIKPFTDAGVPVIVSYGLDFKPAKEHASIVNRVQIAWQMYVSRNAKEPEKTGTAVANLIKARGRCDVANDDAYQESAVPTLPEVRAMFAACQAAGIANHAPYSAWNPDGSNWQQWSGLVVGWMLNGIDFWQTH